MERYNPDSFVDEMGSHGSVMKEDKQGMFIVYDERIEHALRICEGVSLRDLRNAKTGLMKLLCENFEDVRDMVDAKS